MPFHTHSIGGLLKGLSQLLRTEPVPLNMTPKFREYLGVIFLRCGMLLVMEI